MRLSFLEHNVTLCQELLINDLVLLSTLEQFQGKTIYVRLLLPQKQKDQETRSCCRNLVNLQVFYSKKGFDVKVTSHQNEPGQDLIILNFIAHLDFFSLVGMKLLTLPC